jgi:hypothetical protein
MSVMVLLYLRAMLKTIEIFFVFCCCFFCFFVHKLTFSFLCIRVITKLPNSEQSYKGKVKTHNYINRQNQSTTGKLWKPWYRHLLKAKYLNMVNYRDDLDHYLRNIQKRQIFVQHKLGIYTKCSERFMIINVK